MMTRCATLFLCAMILAIPALANMEATEQRQFADGLFARGLYDLALAEYLQLSRLTDGAENPDVVLYRIGECHRRLNNPQVADRFYQRVLVEYPTSEYALRAEFRRAEIQITQGHYMEAVSQFRALLAKDPPAELAASARYYKGYAAKRLLLPEAEEDYRLVMERYPDSPFAAYAAIDLAELLKKNPDRAQEALALYQRVIDQPGAPNVAAEALFQTAEWHFATGNYTAAADAYDRLLREYPDQPRAAEAALQAAWAYHRAGRYADSLKLASTAVADPAQAKRRPEWLYALANAQRQLMRGDDARATYDRLIKEYPDHELVPIASYEVALIAFRQNEFDRAVEEARSIVPDESIRQDLYWLLAESYAGLGREDEAVQNYRLLLDNYPDSVQAPKALYRLGRLLQQRKDYVDAQRAYRDLARSYPDDEFAPAALLASAYCAAMDERYDDALAEWDLLIKTYKDDPLAEEALYQKGLTQMQMERAKPARTTLESFIKKYPDSRFAAEANYWRGILLEQEDRPADAEKSLRAALAAGPETALDERIRYRLAMNLQRKGNDAEAADLIQGLLDTPARRNMPPSLLEWLVGYRLTQNEDAAAVEAARRMTTHVDEPAWTQIAWSLYGRALLRVGSTNDALAAFERSLQEDARTREGAEAALFLGDLELAAEQTAKATTFYERASDAAASDELVDVRAKSYYGLGRAAAAEEDWAKAARYFLGVGILFDDPALTPECLYRAAQALDQTGREEESARTREELLRNYPDSEWSKRLESDLKKEQK